MTEAGTSNPLHGFLAAEDGRPGSADKGIDRILEAVRKHLGMDIAFASRFVDGRREFTHINSDLPAPASPGDSEPEEDTYCWRILHGLLPELIHDANDFPEAVALPITGALPVGAHLNVPLRLSDGRLYGSFCCLSHLPDRTLTPRDLSTMRAFADLAASQIERELDDNARRDARIARISEIVERGHLTMALQPIHRLEDGRPVGVECLARFSDCDTRPPDLWFAEAASVGLGVELEMLAVRQALRALAYIPAEMYLAVNASPATLLSGQLDPVVAAAPAGRLVVEVTEHSRVEDYGAIRAALARLRGRARLAIDDVGAGYSGLRHILDLKPDILKLDMSLTRDVDSDRARATLARAMVAFADSIGATIVAEGVETEAEMRTLRELGIGFGQGFHFSRPMPAIAAQHFLLDVDREEAAPAVPARRPRAMWRAS
jgi:EAL domain-containing protein (putative c-di-GMP-specific phosphodiesterase class I)